MSLKRVLNFDWDAVAGLIAAVAAIVMHFLHLADEELLITIAVVLIALLFIRDLRRERATEDAYTAIAENRAALRSIQTGILPPDAVLVGPAQIRFTSERFSAHARGEMIWFHVCLSMFRPQSLFDTLLRPAIENPHVASIQFILDQNQKELWDADVVPKISACRGKDKVKPPYWTTIRESVSVIIADEGASGKAEVLLSFWGEPFMAYATDRKVPRYIFHVQGHSELVTRLIELVRLYRFKS
jgi:hypothetical protein